MARIDNTYEHEEKKSLFTEEEITKIVKSGVTTMLWKIYGRHLNLCTQADGTITDPAIVRDKQMLEKGIKELMTNVYPCQFEAELSQVLQDKYTKPQLIDAAQNAYELWKTADSNFKGQTFNEAAGFINAEHTALKQLAKNDNLIDFEFSINGLVGITATIINNDGMAELQKRCRVYPNPNEMIFFGLQINY